jgi:predicted PP-loop superfamily ATPase
VQNDDTVAVIIRQCYARQDGVCEEAAIFVIPKFQSKQTSRFHASSQSLFTGNALKAHKGSIAVAMSGGIDSSVAALILKDQGYDCVGVFMTNWDTSDEAGDITCNVNRDREHMKQVCERLNIPAIDVGHHLPLNAEI